MSANGEDRFAWVEVGSAGELHDWLDAHHGQTEAIWLVTFRKAVPERYVSTEEILDELVSFGWIDGARRRIDEHRTRQLVSPRRVQPWAKSYKDRAQRLVADGRMRPAGLASVQRARETGMWDTMNEVDALVVPDDLADALAGAPPAAQHFAAFPPSTRRNILRWIAYARTPPTRTKRIALTVAEARRNLAVKSHG